MNKKRRIHSFDFLHIEAEITQLHAFFQQWFNGEMAPTEENFSRLRNVLAEGFQLVSPDGNLLERLPLLDGLFQAHGSREGMEIWIEEVSVLHWFDRLALATYQEWQKLDGQVTARLSSVLFRDKEDAPNRIEWLHVHETWLDQGK
jgi:hypothetical protein